MTRPPHLSPHAAHGMPASLGGLLWALLCALLGWARLPARPRLDSLEGTLAPVLAAGAAIVLELEPYVEWEAVPAPWRNGQLLPARHARALSVPLPWRFVPAWVLGRGPPWGDFTRVAWRTGMA